MLVQQPFRHPRTKLSVNMFTAVVTFTQHYIFISHTGTLAGKYQILKYPNETADVLLILG